MQCSEYSEILISHGDSMGPMTFRLLWVIKANPTHRGTCYWKYRNYVRITSKTVVQSGTALLHDCILVSFHFNLHDLEKNPSIFHFSYIICAIINGQMICEGIVSEVWFSLTLPLNQKLKWMHCSLTVFSSCWWQS